MESLGTPSITYIKFEQPGQKVEGLFDSIEWDVEGTFGVESNLRLTQPDGSLANVKLSAALYNTFKSNERRFIPGKTRIVIAYTGMVKSKKDKTKTYKNFDVKAEGLAPKAPVSETLTREPGADDDKGDSSFDPSKLS